MTQGDGPRAGPGGRTIGARATMDRRTFFERLARGAVPLVGGAVLIGCGDRKAGLIRDPAPPVFGPPRHGRPHLLKAPARPPSRPPSPPAASAPVSMAAWQPPGSERRWRYIVLHHSATTHGSAAEFDRIHRQRGWDELGYHFVIGNGRGAPDGLVQVGSRWPKQKHGAHCKVAGHPEYNDQGIGVCLVGNFSKGLPTRRQLDSTGVLVRYLMARYGIPWSRVRGHGQLKPTECPGLHFPYGEVRRRVV